MARGPEFVVVDVPGTGFAHRLLFRRLFGAVGVEEDFADGVLQPDSLFRKNEAAWWARESERLLDRERWPPVVLGHIWAGKYPRVFPDVKTITWLRDPAERVASLHRYWVENPQVRGWLPDRVRGLPLFEAAGLPEMRNQMSGVIFRGVDLESLEFVGTVERWEEDARRLFATFGWPDVDVPPVEPASTLDAEMAARIRDINEPDVALYERALSAVALSTS